jgi:hypothetical protein
MKGPDGKPLNRFVTSLLRTYVLYFIRFDRGPIYNVLEFIGMPGFSIDYTSLMHLESRLNGVVTAETRGSESTFQGEHKGTELTTRLTTDALKSDDVSRLQHSHDDHSQCSHD